MLVPFLHSLPSIPCPHHPRRVCGSSAEEELSARPGPQQEVSPQSLPSPENVGWAVSPLSCSVSHLLGAILPALGDICSLRCVASP